MRFLNSPRGLPVPAFLVLALLGVLQVSHFGCSGKSVEDGDPSELYKEAEEDISSDHYQLAVDKLKVIKNKYPYSKFALDASLRLADVYFLQESFTEAALAYESFRDLHPKHERVPYAMFRVGKSYYNDIPSAVSRDLTPATKAQDAYNDFLRRFPNDPNAPEARKDWADIRRQLAEKELYIANFYYKRHFYDSAKNRFEKLLQLYSDTPTAEEAKDKLAKIEKDNLHNEE
jgi:outer membrane protein assembly factor BamD